MTDVGVEAGAAPGHRHVPELDGLRGIAIGLVLVHQLSAIARPPWPTGFGAVIDVLQVGWVGVQLFFVLSGFLITGILLDTKGRPRMLRSFYARRALRIFPLYYGVLLGYFVIVPALGIAVPRDGAVWYWVYLANWAFAYTHFLPALSHFWSLCVEEQFYLVWPFAVAGLSARSLAWACAAFAIVALAVRIGLRATSEAENAAYVVTIARMDALALGGLAALVVRSPRWWPQLRPRAVHAAIVGGIALVGMAALTRGFDRDAVLTQTAGFTILSLECALVLLLVFEPAPGRAPWPTRALRTRSLTLLGKYSYAIYVFHQPLHIWLKPELGALVNAGGIGRRLIAVAVYVVGVSLLAIVAALITWNVFERRLLALKRYFTPG